MRRGEEHRIVAGWSDRFKYRGEIRRVPAAWIREQFRLRSRVLSRGIDSEGIQANQASTARFINRWPPSALRRARSSCRKIILVGIGRTYDRFRIIVLSVDLSKRATLERMQSGATRLDSNISTGIAVPRTDWISSFQHFSLLHAFEALIPRAVCLEQ